MLAMRHADAIVGGLTVEDSVAHLRFQSIGETEWRPGILWLGEVSDLRSHHRGAIVGIVNAVVLDP